MRPIAARTVLHGALVSFRRTFFVHALWNVAFVLVAWLVLLCVGIVFLLPLAMTRGHEVGQVVGTMLSVPLLVVATVVIFSIHQGATLAIAAKERAGAPVSVRAAFDEAFARIELLAPTMLVRVVADALVGYLPVALVTTLLPPEIFASPARPELALAVTCAVVACPLIAVRAYLGVSGPIAFHERARPAAALARSVALLRGRRASMIRVRAIWAVVAALVYGGSHVPLFLGSATARESSLGALLVFLVALLPYATALMLISFDTVLEGVFHAELIRKDDATEIARAFE